MDFPVTARIGFGILGLILLIGCIVYVITPATYIMRGVGGNISSALGVNETAGVIATNNLYNAEQETGQIILLISFVPLSALLYMYQHNQQQKERQNPQSGGIEKVF